MAPITVVIFLLSSVFGIDAGMRHTAQVHNVTHLEKRSSRMILEKIDCDSATYKTVSLEKFVYTYQCSPARWLDFFKKVEVENEIKTISNSLNQAIKGDEEIFFEPPMPDMFNAFQKIGPDDVKVVILGQDPTPQAGQATGMAFSLKQGVNPRTVPSVFNMLVELGLEGFNVDLSNGDLTPWRDQGVLLLNAALTVRQGGGQAGSHQTLWKPFTKLLIEYISSKDRPLAWILWGKEAQGFKEYIKGKYFIKAGGHPSPLGAADFFGHNYFRCANLFLEGIRRGGINWQIPPPKKEIGNIMNQERC